MKELSKLVIAGLLGFVAMAPMPAAALSDDEAISASINAVIDEVMRPGFAAFKSEASTMRADLASLCAEPSDTALKTVRDQFGDLTQSWGKVELIRLGPLVAENRLERILFWPDRRGRGLKQVRDVIRTNDETALQTETLSQKSVAVQGLMALEFSLFGTDAELLATGSAPERCVYAAAIAGNIDNIAGELVDAWSQSGPKSIAYLWTNPSDDNPLFRDGREQLSALFKIIGEGLDIVLVQRLDPFLRDDRASAKPKSALFWRSANTMAMIKSNIAGLQAIAAAAKLDEQLSGGDKRVIGGFFFEFKNAVSALHDVDMPVEELIASQEAYGRANYARIVISSMSAMVRQQLLPLFNLSSGFSSLDGD